MPDLLLELRSEEIPARMQRKAAGDLRKMITDGLVEAGLTYEGCQEYWTPRRLVLDIRGLTARSKDASEERKGPSTRAPEQAIQGFLRGAGLTSIDQAQVHSDPKKGEFYVVHIARPGRAAEAIVAALVPAVIRGFPWPKSMRWGAASGPKGMRYGAGQGLGGDTLRWVRPLQSIVCTFGPETEEPVVVDFEVGGIRSGNLTYGHRFHSPGAISVRRFEDYASKLAAAKVIVDADRRKEMILADAKNLAFANGLDLVEDEALLEEVSGLVEWPVVLLGAFEEEFLAIPPEVVRLTIRANQKCFVVRPSRPASPAPQDEGGCANDPHPEVRAERASKDALSNHFILTANIDAKDGGKEIVHGNGKVVRARLSDALYFWKTDQADLPDLDQLRPSAEKFGLDLNKPLDQRMARLDHLGVTFHAKLGTQGERVQRIARLAEELAPMVARTFTSPLRGGRAEGAGGGQEEHLTPTPALRADPPRKGEGKDIIQLAGRAAVLAKADLTTEIVGEFPELQGAMGRKYALLQGEHPSVAAAIEEHYKPQGPSDSVPTDPVSIAVALADKLDTLVGFWAIDEKPTGSKDPFALRRAALGVIRILVENGVSIRLGSVVSIQAFMRSVRSINQRISSDLDFVQTSASGVGLGAIVTPSLDNEFQARVAATFRRYDPFSGETITPNNFATPPEALKAIVDTKDLLSFFHDRLKVYLRDKGARHDLIDAVLAGGGSAAISPPVGEMSAKPREGGAVPPNSHSATPPSALPGISPSSEEIGQSLPVEDRKSGWASAGQAAPAEGSERGERTSVSETNDDLLAIVRKVEALGAFLATDAGANLLAGARRAANILAAEEKKGTRIAAVVNEALLRLSEEKALFAAVNQAESGAAQAIAAEDFSAVMRALSVLSEPVDSFFEAVLVNDEDADVRANRLALLARIRSATGQVADFSKIAG